MLMLPPCTVNVSLPCVHIAAPLAQTTVLTFRRPSQGQRAVQSVQVGAGDAQVCSLLDCDNTCYHPAALLTVLGIQHNFHLLWEDPLYTCKIGIETTRTYAFRE